MRNAKALWLLQAVGREHEERHVEDWISLSKQVRMLFVGFHQYGEAISPDIRKYVFREVVAGGGEEGRSGFDAVFALATSTPHLQLRTDAFVALGYARHPLQIAKALNLFTAVGQPFNRMEKWFLLRALQTRRAGAEASWNWLRQNWAGSLQGNFDQITLQRFVASCTGSLSMKEHLIAVEDFAEENSVHVSFWTLNSPRP